MLKKICTLGLLLAASCTYAQNYRITWGEEMKLKKGTMDMDIVGADASGFYLAEGHMRMKSYFIVGATFAEEQKLIKVDKSFNEVFEKVYRKELKGYSFHSFQLLENDLFLFATDYDKRAKTQSVFAVRLNKNSGELMDELKEIGTYNLESKKDNFELRVEAVNGGKNFLMVSDVSGKDRTSLAVELLDGRLQKKQSTIINLSYTPGRYSLQDVKYTRQNKVVLLGKEMDEVQVGRRKKKRVVFKQYALAIYNTKGKKEKDVAVDAGSRFIIGGKLIEQPDHNLLLAGFYSNDAKKEDLNGFYINKLDMGTGELAVSSFQEITPAMLGQVQDGTETEAEKEDAADDKKAYKKEGAKGDDEEEEFPNSFIIRSVAVNPEDQSYVITAEISKYSRYTYMTTSGTNGMMRTNWVTVHRFTNDDILVVSADAQGAIRWINAVPKSQLEEVRSNQQGMGAGISFSYDYTGYFAQGGGIPYYSSYNTLLHKNKLVIIMNDHEGNLGITEWGKRVKRISNFKNRSNVYGISIDLATGKTERKVISANSTDLILMPRHSYVVGSEVIIPSMRQKMLGKSELKVAKVAVR